MAFGILEVLGIDPKVLQSQLVFREKGVGIEQVGVASDWKLRLMSDVDEGEPLVAGILYVKKQGDELEYSMVSPVPGEIVGRGKIVKGTLKFSVQGDLTKEVLEDQRSKILDAAAEIEAIGKSSVVSITNYFSNEVTKKFQNVIYADLSYIIFAANYDFADTLEFSEDGSKKAANVLKESVEKTGYEFDLVSELPEKDLEKGKLYFKKDGNKLLYHVLSSNGEINKGKLDIGELGISTKKDLTKEEVLKEVLLDKKIEILDHISKKGDITPRRYDLCLMSTLPEKGPKAEKLYFEKTKDRDELNYVALSPNNKLIEGKIKIDLSDLGDKSLTEEFLLSKKTEILEAIQKSDRENKNRTSGEKHIVITAEHLKEKTKEGYHNFIKRKFEEVEKSDKLTEDELYALCVLCKGAKGLLSREELKSYQALIFAKLEKLRKSDTLTLVQLTTILDNVKDAFGFIGEQGRKELKSYQALIFARLEELRKSDTLTLVQLTTILDNVKNIFGFIGQQGVALMKDQMLKFNEKFVKAFSSIKPDSTSEEVKARKEEIENLKKDFNTAFDIDRRTGEPGRKGLMKHLEKAGYKFKEIIKEMGRLISGKTKAYATRKQQRKILLEGFKRIGAEIDKELTNLSRSEFDTRNEAEVPMATTDAPASPKARVVTEENLGPRVKNLITQFKDLAHNQALFSKEPKSMVQTGASEGIVAERVGKVEARINSESQSKGLKPKPPPFPRPVKGNDGSQTEGLPTKDKGTHP